MLWTVMVPLLLMLGSGKVASMAKLEAPPPPPRIQPLPPGLVQQMQEGNMRHPGWSRRSPAAMRVEGAAKEELPQDSGRRPLQRPPQQQQQQQQQESDGHVEAAPAAESVKLEGASSYHKTEDGDATKRQNPESSPDETRSESYRAGDHGSESDGDIIKEGHQKDIANKKSKSHLMTDHSNRGDPPLRRHTFTKI